MKMLALLAVVAAFAGCTDPAPGSGNETAREHLARHMEPGYVCPMHPDVTSDEPGSCPVCGMDLVQKKATPRSETAREHLARHMEPGYVCPMHPEVTSDEPGSCPVCGMDLVRRTPSASQGAPLYYRHPHRPEITSPEPMQDEMGMDFVPVYPEPRAGGVTVTGTVRHNLGIRVAQARLEPLPRRVHAPGFVSFDERRLRHIHTRAEGWIEALNVGSLGDEVRQGQTLFEIFSPVLASAEEEYLQALQMGGEGLISASANRLRALGIEESAIARLRKTRSVDGRVRFPAPIDGIVVGLDARQGMFVRPMTDIVVLADLSRVWIEADVLAREAGWIKAGLPAEVRIPGHPERVWRGGVAYVYPEVDPVSRAVVVRLEFENPDGLLRPNSFASVRIIEPSPDPVIQIPAAAVIRSGRAVRVIVESSPGRFEPRPVTVAFEAEGQAAIGSGLEAGEAVVVSGQFMIDSEASLTGELDRLAGAADDQP
jgi:multidrug efflux pump subunit AcrA (membrane-fusion protein)